ncbi:MAG TPA: peptidoglycan-binding domain-containing protein [Xanthobacteraceae bacterium]|nr:peptidoglycan-binding domain-containing protein [Xanthobacteraceae bacterium]
MRIIVTTLVSLAAIWPAGGEAAKKRPVTAPKAAPTKPGPPAPGSPRAVYAAMPEAERRAIQADLIWTGDYNGLIEADFGDNSVAAVKAFQKRNGGKETGILNLDERAKLAESARTKRQNAGWRVVDDRASGARLGVPTKFAPHSSAAASGTHWQSSRGEVQVETFHVTGTTLEAAFEKAKKQPANREVDYHVIKPDFFVVSGMQGGVKKFYVRGEIRNNEVRGVTILYDKAMEGLFDRIVVAMSNAFVGFPPATPADQPAAQGPVGYATGVVISDAGDIITDRAAVADCQFIVIAGHGNAVRIGEDKAVGLALLRLFGARGLVPATLGDPGGGSDVMLVGIADPQAQSGGDAVSTIKAHLQAANGAERPLDAAPAAGFAGAAAIDGDDKLIGIVDAQSASGAGPQATVVTSEAIRTFLAAQKVPPASVAGTDIKASVVRVMCVRAGSKAMVTSK